MPRLQINLSVSGRATPNSWDAPHAYGDSVSFDVEAEIDFLRLSKPQIVKMLEKHVEQAIVNWERAQAEELRKLAEAAAETDSES